MSVWVLSDEDVRAVLDMESCIEAMADVLSSLARGELHQPLRFVVRPPTDELLGLMPAWRGGTAPVFSLKEIVISPGNSARGLDPHQGAVLLHDGVTGQLRAILNASAITEIRTAAVSAVATRALARPDASRRWRSSARACRDAPTSHAMRASCPTPSSASGAGRPSTRSGLRLRSNATACRVGARRRSSGADVVCTTTASREPILQRELARPRRSRQRGRLVRAVGARARRRHCRRGVAVRRSARVDGERVRRLPGGGRGGRHRRRPHPRRARRGARRHCTRGAPTTTELTLFKSLGLAVEDLAAAELCVARARGARHRRRRSTSDPARRRSRRRAIGSRDLVAAHAAAAAAG